MIEVNHVLDLGYKPQDASDYENVFRLVPRGDTGPVGGAVTCKYCHGVSPSSDGCTECGWCNSPYDAEEEMERELEDDSDAYYSGGDDA
jgi:hypothetical protein